MRIETWKLVLVALVFSIGVLFALPNALPASVRASLPSWLHPVNLGLDLQGGSHLLLEVDIKAVFKEQATSLVETARSQLRKESIRYLGLGASVDGIHVTIPEPEQREKASELLRKIDPGTEMVVGDNGAVALRFTEFSIAERRRAVVGQSIEIVRRRIDELGTRESTIIRQGDDRILVQLPGLQDPEQVKRLLGKTAKLTFHLVDHAVSPQDALAGRIPPGSEALPLADAREQEITRSVVVRKRVELGGESLVDSQASFSEGMPVVNFRFNGQGSKRFGAITVENAGKQFAIVLDGKVISAPVIREPILGGSGMISGNFTVQTANDLALLLRAGALPAPLTILEERTVGPDLGADSIQAGKTASIIGLVFVACFMVLVYGSFGLFADVALLVNLVLLLGLLSMIGATLTLPGIAGIVLTMGMAVDANVLIFERMREEFRLGRGIVSACTAGFKRALVTIVDSQLTTLIAAILLYQFGTGPVRGFAVTLAIGLFTSMFTAILVVQLMITAWLKYARPKALPI
ncbi:MAG: protein translocase subunit SecD [Alphaproteobacteria bacterium]|nr:protein translocase subunit SecD [Alphaproteobacteria bacterium]